MDFRLLDYAAPIRIFRLRRFMDRTPGWSAARMDAWQRERRREIAEHAARTVPYYRRLFAEAGVDPARTDRDDVWEGLPTLTKQDVIAHRDELVSEAFDPRRGVWGSTSGSTGEPLEFLLDRNVNAAAFAMFWRAWSSGGYWRFGQRHALLKGADAERPVRHRPAIRALSISSGAVRPGTVGEIRDALARYRPRFLRGYPSAIALLCRLLRDAGLELHVPMVVCNSEILHDFQREVIEATLGARVYNHYAHWERCASILECDEGRLHAQEDFGHHEILDDEGRSVARGVPGEITVTTLYNRAMPLLRYRTRDIGAWSVEPCPCGQPFPVVETIHGRQGNYLVASDGSVLPAIFVGGVIKSLPAVVAAQMVQEERGTVEVRVVPSAAADRPYDPEPVRRAFSAKMGPGYRVDVRVCGLGDLERSPVGKVQSCISRIAPASAGVPGVKKTAAHGG